MKRDRNTLAYEWNAMLSRSCFIDPPVLEFAQQRKSACTVTPSLSGSRSVIGHDGHQSRVGHARLMTFSWWIWSAIVLVGLVGAGLLVRATVLTIREYGFGRGRLTSRPGAPWFWAGAATLFAAGLSTIGWAYSLDG